MTFLRRLMAKRRFTIVLIKPSHYDYDGYVIQWRAAQRSLELHGQHLTGG